MNLDLLTQKAVQAAINAGELISSYRDTEVNVLKKDTGSTLASQVVTEVDRKSQEAILRSCCLPVMNLILLYLPKRMRTIGVV